ncbi:MAG: HutD family protein [Crocinitomicaceae bacterium]|nr:HutD family protein [Crocinitomicaceae bacterium]
MSIQHFDASRIKKTNWSGGTTSELFIFPEGSEFNIGNYLFRLSIATVEIEESTFTRLPDVNRTLMVLEGILKLEHEGHHKATLKPLEFDNFKGDWNTKSWGKVTNFNLMTKGDFEGSLSGIKLEKGAEIEISMLKGNSFIHTYSGSTIVSGQNCQKYESILIEGQQTISILAKQESILVIVELDS